jgi:hypothetical protein
MGRSSEGASSERSATQGCCFWIEELGALNLDVRDRELEVGHGRRRATCLSSDPEKLLCARWSQGEGSLCRAPARGEMRQGGRSRGRREAGGESSRHG